MGPLAFMLSVSRIIVAVMLVVLSPTMNISIGAANWLAYVVLLVQFLILALLLLVTIFKVVEILLRVTKAVPFDENRSSRAGGISGAMRKMDGRRGYNSSPKSRAALNRRFSNLSHDTTRPMITSKESSLSKASTYGRSTLGDDGFIMSAMAGDTSAGYIPPSAYSTVAQPHSPRLHQSQRMSSHNELGLAAPIVSSTGFTRVEGGRATSENPNEVKGPTFAGYPPTRGSNRYSQSALIESALPASTSQLFSNTTSPRYSADPLPHTPNVIAKKPRKGVFGRWKKQAEEVSSEDDSADEEEKRSVWAPLQKFRRDKNKDREVALAATATPEFVVMRKPKLSPASSTTPRSTSTVALPTPTPPSVSTEITALPTMTAAPHVSVQPPSRPNSGIVEHSIGVAGDWDDLSPEEMERMRMTLG